MGWEIVIGIWISLIIVTALYIPISELIDIYERKKRDIKYKKWLKRKENLEKEGKSFREIIEILGRENREELKNKGIK